MPRKSPRSPPEGRPPPTFGRFGRFPAFGRFGRFATFGRLAAGRPFPGTFGKFKFGLFPAPPPRSGMLGRVVGRFTVVGRFVSGRVVGSDGRADGEFGGDGRVDGFNPPDGRLACGRCGMDGRSIFGVLILGRPGAGRLGAGLVDPRFGTLGRAAPPPPPPPPRLRAAPPPPPPPPPPRNPRAETSTRDTDTSKPSARALTMNWRITQCLSLLFF